MPLDKTLLEKIRNNDTTLTSLNLYGNQIGDAGAKDLSNALKHNTTLTSLDLGNNLIGAAGAKDLSDVLKHNTTLLSLDLGDNQIGAAGAKDLSDALKHNTIITSLNLYSNQIGDVGAKDLSDALKYNTTLTSLYLGNNEIGAAGAKDLSNALNHNTTLTSLDLSYNQIGAAGAKDLSDALTHNTTLTSLNLIYNQINVAHLQVINALIQRNQQTMLARRQEFIFKIIMLARNAKDPNPDSLWANLPKEIKLHVISYLNLASESYIGKTAKQTKQCVQFIFSNIDECNVLIKDKQKIKLIEKQDVRGNYQFHFFKSSAYPEAKKRDKISIKEQPKQAKCHITKKVSIQQI
jgi:Ran GTPase-activating protein (RanGAP) involved in mRNA processing and transport